GPLSAATRPRQQGASSIRPAPGPRAAPAPLRIQQPIPPAVRRQRTRGDGHQPERQARRGDRAAGPSLVFGGAVPSGVQVEADRGTPLVRGVHPGGARAAGGEEETGGGTDTERSRHSQITSFSAALSLDTLRFATPPPAFPAGARYAVRLESPSSFLRRDD